MGDGFKAHDWKRGHRLERLQALGPAGLSRRIVEAAAVIEAPGVKGPAIAKVGRPRTIDGRFGKRLPEPQPVTPTSPALIAAIGDRS